MNKETTPLSEKVLTFDDIQEEYGYCDKDYFNDVDDIKQALKEFKEVWDWNTHKGKSKIFNNEQNIWSSNDIFSELKRHFGSLAE